LIKSLLVTLLPPEFRPEIKLIDYQFLFDPNPINKIKLKKNFTMLTNQLSFPLIEYIMFSFSSSSALCMSITKWAHYVFRFVRVHNALTIYSIQFSFSYNYKSQTNLTYIHKLSYLFIILACNNCSCNSHYLFHTI
jgi:hypothetical protein